MREQDMSDADRDLLGVVRKAVETAEPYHRAWRKKANHFYALYRSYQDWRGELDQAKPRGQDELRNQARRQWGAELFIPWCFSVIETIVPRMLAHRPKMLVLPVNPDSEANCENMKYLIDRQQEQIDYEMVLQEIVKTGLIYGIAFQKIQWKEEWRQHRQIAPSEAPAPEQQSPWAILSTMRKVFDDPDAESIDPMDVLYDPYAGSKLSDCDFVIHRTWRTMKYIRRMIELGRWRNLDGDLKDIEGKGGQQYDQVWSERRRADRLPSPSKSRKEIHEVLEFHDGEQVIQVLDRELVVASGPNPHWHGEYPFQAFRPTIVPNQLAGIGEVEPIEDLQEEINTLRSQRRDNATLVLQKVFAYMDGMVEAEDLKFAPGHAIPVDGDPQQLLFPINVGDIPHSSYQEEDRLNEDFQRVTGISEPITGANMTAATATGMQLAQAAAGERIKNKSRRAERELVKPGARQFGCLNQQKILSNRDVRIPSPPTPEEPDRRWSWRQLTPLEMAGEFEYEPEGGSMEPENRPMLTQEAQTEWMMFANNPNIDQQELVRSCLAKLGHKHPERFLRPPEPKVPDAFPDMMVDQLVANGADLGQAKTLVAQTLQAAMQEQMAGASAPSQNGASGIPPQQPQPEGAPA